MEPRKMLNSAIVEIYMDLKVSSGFSNKLFP